MRYFVIQRRSVGPTGKRNAELISDKLRTQGFMCEIVSEEDFFSREAAIREAQKLINTAADTLRAFANNIEYKKEEK